MTTKAELITRMDAHDAEGEAIAKAMADLKLDPKEVKAIRKAQAKAASAQKTLDELMGIDPKTAAKIGAEGGA